LHNFKVTALEEKQWLGKAVWGKKVSTFFHSGKGDGIHETVPFVVVKSMKGNILGSDPLNKRVSVLQVEKKIF
jgi:hypothetical protein